ncbi:MAG: mRNA surveillance protein pelota [Archaeoglobus sp.]|nr:MAG: mRNA surveillance protein pelota [Archaeoglobus sp.]
MKVIEENLRNVRGKIEGELKLVPESLDDLWHLKYVIEPGDIVFSLTKRVSESTDKLRSDKEMVTVRLGIEVEKVEFHRFANRLRISGKIVGGVEDSGHHTLNIGVGKELSIIKIWKKEQLERIEGAVKASSQPEVVIVTIEEGDAVLGVLRQWGVEEVTSVRKSYGKESSLRVEFFNDVLQAIKNLSFKYMIVAGPGFTKDDFLRFLREKDPEIATKSIIADCSTIGVRGFIEVLKRGVVSKIVKDIRLAEEARYIEKLLEGISKCKKVAYGIDDVKKACEYGAVEVLMVADEFLREEREKWDIDSLLEKVENMGGKVVILSTDFEPGKMLMALGGIGALLRFDVQ